MENSKKKQQIALFIGLNATGHVNSLMGIADRLKDNHNFRTIFLIPGPTNIKTIERHGHELFTMIGEVNTRLTNDPNEMYSARTEVNDAMDKSAELLEMEPLESYLKLMRDGDGFIGVLKDNMVRQHDSILRLLNEVKPDLVVVDTWFISPAVLKLKHIPWVYICSANPSFFLRPKTGSNQSRHPPCLGLTLWNKGERNRMRQEEPEKWKRIQNEWSSIYKLQQECVYKDAKFDKLFEDHGFEPTDAGPYMQFSPHLNIYQISQDIDYSQEDDLLEYPERWFRCDSFIRKSLNHIDPNESKVWTEKLDEAMKGKEAMVYFSLGTVASGIVKVLQRYIDILKADKTRLYVVSKGVEGDAIELDSDNMIGGNYLPQPLILQRANLAIIHGGNNSTTECLYHATPMIIIPCFGDQFDNAQRIVDLGLGKRLHIKNTTKQELFKTIEEVLSDNLLHQRLKEIGKRMQARDDLAKISLMLKKLADEKHLNDTFINECRDKHFTEINF